MPSRAVRDRPPRTRGGPRGRMAGMDTDTTEASTDHPDESAFGPVGVVGAGAMGAGIAQVAATAGHAVTLVDAAPGAAAAAVERVGASLSRLVEQGRLSADDATAVRRRITPAEALDELR